MAVSVEYAREKAAVDERMDFVEALSDSEREAMKQAWLATVCTHEFPEDQRITFRNDIAISPEEA